MEGQAHFFHSLPDILLILGICSPFFLLCYTETRGIQQRSSSGHLTPVGGGQEKETGTRKLPPFSLLPSILTPEKHSPCFPPLCANTSCSIRSHVTGQLGHTAAGLRLRLLLLCWLFQFQERRVAAGWRVIDRAPVGGDQGHAGVLRVGFGIREGVRGAVAKVTIKQGVIQQLGGSPLFLELRQRLGALFRPGLLLGGLGASIRRQHGAVGGQRRQRGRRRGDETILCARAIFQNGLQPWFVWLLDRRHRFDLQNME